MPARRPQSRRHPCPRLTRHHPRRTMRPLRRTKSVNDRPSGPGQLRERRRPRSTLRPRRPQRRLSSSSSAVPAHCGLLARSLAASSRSLCGCWQAWTLLCSPGCVNAMADAVVCPGAALLGLFTCCQWSSGLTEHQRLQQCRPAVPQVMERVARARRGPWDAAKAARPAQPGPAPAARPAARPRAGSADARPLHSAPGLAEPRAAPARAGGDAAPSPRPPGAGDAGRPASAGAEKAAQRAREREARERERAAVAEDKQVPPRPRPAVCGRGAVRRRQAPGHRGCHFPP